MFECLLVVCIGFVLCICVWFCLNKLYPKKTTTGLSSLELYEEVSHNLEYGNHREDYDELLSLLDVV